MIAHPLPVLVNAWGVGWAMSRGTPAPVETPGGFRVDVGDHGHRVRHVFHTYDRDALAAIAPEPGTWIKTAGELPRLPGRSYGPPGHLMTVELREEKAEPPTGHTLRFIDGDVTTAVVETADGTRAAHARLALAGEFAIIDRVATEPEHRRRGLGRLVVGALTSRAREAGAGTGVLVASDVGRDLYTAMGWRWCSHLPSTFVAE